ncbi:hypothetical protein ASG66_07730 [Bacillus sp. Leaf406]|nr:hypothetical protein ASG66_07730 [Bacillus sp. Leaf406]
MEWMIMKNRIKDVLPFLIILASAILLIQMLYKPETRESIIFFPIDQNASFLAASTSMNLTQQKDQVVDWTVASELDSPSYLRQDVGLLFSNGKLKGVLNKWKPNTSSLYQKMKVEGDESNLLQAVAYHYAEIHEGEDTFKSAQTMSSDRLYIIDSAFNPLGSFKTPTTDVQAEWKKSLDGLVTKTIETSWAKGLRELQINGGDYNALPLTELPAYSSRPYPGFTPAQWAKVTGNLWEGLYKNYAIGIKKEDGAIQNPVDSTIPLILLKKDRKEVLVLIIDKKGEAALLRQSISY